MNEHTLEDDGRAMAGLELILRRQRQAVARLAALGGRASRDGELGAMLRGIEDEACGMLERGVLEPAPETRPAVIRPRCLSGVSAVSGHEGCDAGASCDGGSLALTHTYEVTVTPEGTKHIVKASGSLVAMDLADGLVGPGQSYMIRLIDDAPGPLAAALGREDTEAALATLAELWSAGVGYSAEADLSARQAEVMEKAHGAWTS